MTRQGVTFCALGGPCVHHACIREPSFQPSLETVITTGLTLLLKTLLKRGRPLGEETSLRQLPIPVLALHVLVCQPVSQVREQASQGPVTHCSYGVGEPTLLLPWLVTEFAFGADFLGTKKL